MKHLFALYRSNRQMFLVGVFFALMAPSAGAFGPDYHFFVGPVCFLMAGSYLLGTARDGALDARPHDAPERAAIERRLVLAAALLYAACAAVGLLLLLGLSPFGWSHSGVVVGVALTTGLLQTAWYWRRADPGRPT